MLKIDTWVVAPYKKPERDIPNNEVFNNHVSIVRIRSEHAIGFLKGRFQSLKSLRTNIKDKSSHQIATYWVAACIGLHAFAMQCEDEEREDEEPDSDHVDPFILEGLSSGSSDSDVNAHAPAAPAQGQRSATTRLREAKAYREYLQERLFAHKDKRAKQRAEQRRAMRSL